MASFSQKQSCVATSSGMAEYYAMCSTAEELLHSGSVLKGQNLGGEDASAAKNCSRSWTTNQVSVFEGEQGRSGDESSICGHAQRVASCVWDRGPWRISV